MKQGFIICSSFAKELEFVIKKLNLPHIETRIVPSTCGNANNEECIYFKKRTTEFEQKVEYSNILMSQSCVGCENIKSRKDNGNHVFSPFCLEHFVPAQLLNHYIENKYYIITPGWLLQWKHTIVNRWKFDKETAPLFFNDTAKEILVIDTGVYRNYDPELKEFSEYINLKYTILPFGTDFFEKNIEAITYKQLQQNKTDEFLKFKKEETKDKNPVISLEKRLDFNNIQNSNYEIGKLTEMMSIKDNKTGKNTAIYDEEGKLTRTIRSRGIYK
jgi:hypothetical protein